MGHGAPVAPACGRPATAAGGDLQGPVSRQFLDLNYGGGGLAAGAQHAFDSSFLAGLAVATDSSSYSADGTSGRVGGWHLAGYAGARAGGLYGVGVVSGDFFTLDTDRSFEGLGAAELIRGKTHGRSLTAKVEFGYDFKLARVTLTPFASIQRSTLWMDAYTEATVTGPDLFPLSFAAQTTHSEQSGLGFQLASASGGSPTDPKPYVRVEWRHEFDPGRGVTPTFADFSGGAPFEIVGARAARDLARVETGVDWNVTALDRPFRWDFRGGGRWSGRRLCPRRGAFQLVRPTGPRRVRGCGPRDLRAGP